MNPFEELEQSVRKLQGEMETQVDLGRLEKGLERLQEDIDYYAGLWSELEDQLFGWFGEQGGFGLLRDGFLHCTSETALADILQVGALLPSNDPVARMHSDRSEGSAACEFGCVSLFSFECAMNVATVMYKASECFWAHSCKAPREAFILQIFHTTEELIHTSPSGLHFIPGPERLHPGRLQLGPGVLVHHLLEGSHWRTEAIEDAHRFTK